MDKAQIAAQLEAAMTTIDQYLPSGKVKVAALHCLGIEAARLRRDERHRVCGQCGGAFIWGIADQRYDLSQQAGPPEACPACRATEAPVTRICRRCNQPFPFSPGEQAFYAARQFVPPQFCRWCREQRRQEREQAGSPARSRSYEG